MDVVHVLADAAEGEEVGHLLARDHSGIAAGEQRLGLLGQASRLERVEHADVARHAVGALDEGPPERVALRPDRR